MTVYRCFGCDRVTADSGKVTIGSGGLLRCRECLEREAVFKADPDGFSYDNTIEETS